MVWIVLAGLGLLIALGVAKRQSGPSPALSRAGLFTRVSQPVAGAGLLSGGRNAPPRARFPAFSIRPIAGTRLALDPRLLLRAGMSASDLRVLAGVAFAADGAPLAGEEWAFNPAVGAQAVAAWLRSLPTSGDTPALLRDAAFLETKARDVLTLLSHTANPTEKDAAKQREWENADRDWKDIQAEGTEAVESGDQAAIYAVWARGIYTAIYYGLTLESRGDYSSAAIPGLPPPSPQDVADWSLAVYRRFTSADVYGNG